MLFAGVSPAYAHDQLLSSSPGTDERLTTAPTEVTVEFTDEIMDLGTVLLLSDAAGTTWELDEPALDGARVVASVAATLPDGGYTLAWRVVSADGHPISGVIPFTVGDTAAASPADDTADDPASDAAGDGANVATPDAQDAEVAGAQSGMPPLLRTLLLGAGGAALALALAWAFTVWRRRARG
ncbi:hypothetical protein AWU67_15410 [Microterricola viridarii]|uniref:CopC domain-containing protein n=2 Tax=Microterricola viridarii TaxID=412690 RepID=A0A0Y0PD79_9MICO|nr:hypothetical protein AWU67_15410 [Microterricola viridarii]